MLLPAEPFSSLREVGGHHHPFFQTSVESEGGFKLDSFLKKCFFEIWRFVCVSFNSSKNIPSLAILSSLFFFFAFFSFFPGVQWRNKPEKTVQLVSRH